MTLFLIPVAGLGPAIHAFFYITGLTAEDVGGRNKSSHGELGLRRCAGRLLLIVT